MTIRTDAKAGVSDPLTRRDCGQGLTDKSYLGDNRLVASESSYRRSGSAPLLKTLGRHESNLKACNPEFDLGLFEIYISSKR